MKDLLKRLMLVPSVSGREDKIREAIKKEILPYADEISVDSMGNLIARKKGNGKRIMLCAHMDEIGFFVTNIEDNGRLSVCGVGGVNTLSASFQEVVSENGVSGVIFPENSKEVPKAENLTIDIGAKNKKQAEKLVEIGDFFVCKPKLEKLQNQRYIGRPVDDRVGCAILIDTLKRVKSDNDLYFVFSVQEEVGGRGAKPAAFGIAPDYGIAVDVTYSKDAGELMPTKAKLGGGCAIKIKDDGAISSPVLVKRMRELAKAAGIKYQDEIILAGGTDASAMQIAGRGTMVGAISIPMSNIHTSCEMFDMLDVKEAVKLAVELCEKLN